MSTDNPHQNDSQREAFNRQSVEKIVEYLSFGADPNSQKDSGETILHEAARSSSTQAVITLIEAGADPNLAANDGVTPFMAAVNAKRFDSALYMLDYKADVNFQPTPQSMSPLYRAIFFDTLDGHTNRTAFLLERGANPDALIELPDGQSLTMTAWADQCDQEAGRRLFADLFTRHTDRDIRGEVIKARQTVEGQQRRMDNLRKASRADRHKFILRPR